MNENQQFNQEPNVGIIKLINGETLIAAFTIDEQDSVLVLHYPLKMMTVQQGSEQRTYLVAWVSVSEDEVFYVPMSNVVNACNANDDTVEYFHNMYPKFYGDGVECDSPVSEDDDDDKEQHETQKQLISQEESESDDDYYMRLLKSIPMANGVYGSH